jgi:NAD dependent epimerase/dehydratase family enzyme
MAEMFLEGSRVSVNKVAAAGYNFIFPELEDALGDLLKK